MLLTDQPLARLFEPLFRVEGFDYLTALSVRSLDDLPEDLAGVRISRRRCAVFKHASHALRISATCDAIFREWQPKSGLEIGTEPFFVIERYDPTFAPDSGQGSIEIWVPIKG
jgi:AraC family transcriptional regulator